MFTLEGVIRRRVLLNFRADPSAIAPLLPAPLEVLPYDGFAIVGVCLIGMEQLRPKGLPGALGLSSENMAHRVAIRYPTDEGMKDGVFVWRRETDQCLVTLLGGRLFPGVHHHANFVVDDGGEDVSIAVRTEDGLNDVSFEGSPEDGWQPGSVFPTFDHAVEFFRRGDCGFSCSLRGDRLEGLQLKTLRWQMSALRTKQIRSAFFQDPSRFPPGLVDFDCALLMRGIPHEWHEMAHVPELAGSVEGV
jgi:Uncharacterized conserved protein (COG2071)